MARIEIDSKVDDYQHALGMVHALFGVKDTHVVVSPYPFKLDTAAETPETAETPAKPAVKRGGKRGGKKPRPTEPGTEPIEGFTPLRMARYVQHLTPVGREVLRYMAQHAPRIEMVDIQNHFEITPRKWAGTMTTFGVSRKHTPGVDRLPFVRDDRRFYTVDERVAKMALDALDKLGL